MLTRGSVEADHRRTRRLRPQLPNPFAHDGVAAAKAAGPQLLVHPDCCHVRIAFQELADEDVVLIQRARPTRRFGQWRRRPLSRTLLLEAVYHVLHRRPRDAQFAGNLSLRRLRLPALHDLVA
jgi:hypothetical protein